MVIHYSSFTIARCLDRDLGTHSRVLHVPADVSANKSGIESCGWRRCDRPFVDNSSDSLPNYIVRVKTGTQTPSHADETKESNALSIVLIDSLNDSPPTALQRIHPSARSLLQPGQEDRFEITIPPMQEVRTPLVLSNRSQKISPV